VTFAVDAVRVAIMYSMNPSTSRVPISAGSVTGLCSASQSANCLAAVA
jgi:hypothetical protein